MKKKAIFLEWGHWKINWFRIEDKGTCYGGFNERDTLVPIANEITKILTKKLPTLLIQPVGVNTNATLWKKIKYINDTIEENGFKKEECITICLHINAVKDHKFASGVETWTSLNPTSIEQLIARNIRRWMTKYYDQRDRGNKKGNLYIKRINSETVLLEMGFIEDLKFMDYATNEYKRIAESISHGLMNFIRINN